eukprot:CAMPEP_0168759606 /NCGR_PEP_ID=MMETSP0724-20121128/22319_1 /TAXON_ID=265536 /ORGANISM="Amphiprora sp., Strain CCMP467" /LENGTH=53 /DNA_ID=CAMNT_0008808553 /DNA_START=63 /DNA_END=221 /DNA_ORIENTATION=-
MSNQTSAKAIKVKQSWCVFPPVCSKRSIAAASSSSSSSFPAPIPLESWCLKLS